VRPAGTSRRSPLHGARLERAPRLLTGSRALGHRWVRRLTLQRSDGGMPVPRPPLPCPPGARTGPPDFVGIGGQRCGTTRWFRLIASHPEVSVPPLAKELHYFDRFYEGGFTAADAKRYGEYFPRREGQRAGEWTPLYASAPWIPGLLARAAPRAKLLMLVRDPVERFASGLQHNARQAREQGMALSRLAPVEAFARGLYHAQVEAVLAHFDRSQLLVLQYERCARDPLSQLRRTFEFLGVGDGFVPPELDARPNSQLSKPRLDPEVRDSYVRAYREDVVALASAFPQIDLGLWPNFADLAG
jgi:Sulfotransferase domain